MNHRVLTAAALLSLVMAAGCSTSPATSIPPSGGASAAGAQKINVVLTNTGCVADRTSVPAGAYVFSIVNEGGTAVSEVELMKGETILGERENLTPGLSGTFTLELQPDTYLLYCPGATTEKSDFVVTASGTASNGPASHVDQLLAQATEDYDAYVRDQVAQLVVATRAFTDAVRAGDIDRAKALYGPARLPYERIEPVAESFGDLDPQIDGRGDDVASPESFTGFHRVEKALWADASLEAMTPIADKLDADVARLDTLVATAEYQPAQLANGAAELLDEIGASKITGEEERYSHIDLLDFQGNLEGARKAYDLVSPALVIVDPALNSMLATEFAAVETMLAQHEDGDGYVAYTELTDEQTRNLAQAVNALAEPMSQVAAKLVG